MQLGVLWVLGTILYAGATGSYAATAPIVFVPIVIAIPVLASYFTSRARHGENGLLWRGHIAFDEDDFDDRVLFPSITRTPRPGLGRQGLSGGMLELRTDGMHWRAGSLLTPGCELSGSFFLPWTKIVSVDIGDIPMKVRFLGGAITIYVDGDSEELYGEFLGSRKGLLHALLRSPLGA